VDNEVETTDDRARSNYGAPFLTESRACPKTRFKPSIRSTSAPSLTDDLTFRSKVLSLSVNKGSGKSTYSKRSLSMRVQSQAQS